MPKKVSIEASKKIVLHLVFIMINILILFNAGYVLAEEQIAFKQEWLSTFGDTNYDEAYSVISVQEVNEKNEEVESLVFTGTISDESGLQYTALVKTDSKGGTIWEKKFSGAFHSVGHSVCQTKDGGYVIAGINKTTIQSNDKILLIKTDAHGNLEWEKNLDLAEQGYSNTRRQGYSVKEVSDGYIIAGSIIAGETSDALVVKTDNLGTVQWARSYGGVEWDCFYDIEPVSDGLIAAGYKESNNKKYEYVVKIRMSGDIIWEYSGIIPDSQVKDLIIAKDGSIVASGYRNFLISLLCIGSEGTSHWESVYSEGIGYSVAQFGSGDFVIAADGKIIGAKVDGSKAWEKSLKQEKSFVNSVTISSSGSMIFAGYTSLDNSDACLFELASDRALLGISSTNALKGGTVYLFSPVFTKTGQLDKSGDAEVKVKIIDNNEENWVILHDADSGVTDDFEILDGVYSGIYDVAGPDSLADMPGVVNLELYVDGILEDTKTINVVKDIDLVVLTDYYRMYKEFLDTGTSKGEDKNTNRIPDFYDLVERINKYANDHKGIVLDVSKEILTKKGQSFDYSNFSYDHGDAAFMGIIIDELLNYISQTSKFKYVAILGDDEVIPFYRRSDPTIEQYQDNPPAFRPMEAGYVPDDMRGKYWGNPTLRDTRDAFIMTDAPYGSYSDTNPDTVPFPIPDAGVGRIFADNPLTLINMINGFETPINVIPEKSRAVILALDSDLPTYPEGVDFPRAVRNAVRSVLKTKYKRQMSVYAGPPYKDNYFYWFDGTYQEWGANDLVTAIEEATITALWSHAQHVLEETQGHPLITDSDFIHLDPSPGHILINAGCHSGYSVSHNNSFQSYESYRPYERAMVNEIISKQVAYLAPSTYGLSRNDTPTAHDLFAKNFLNALLNSGGAVGDKLKSTYRAYRNGYNYTHCDVSVYAIYGIAYYGLPTQMVVTTDEELAAFNQNQQMQNNRQAQDNQQMRNIQAVEQTLRGKNVDVGMNSTGENHSMNISVNIPEFKKTVDDLGKIMFQVPNCENYVKTSFAPVFPMISKTYILPEGSVVNSVTMKNQSQKLLDEQIEQTELKAAIPINKTLGALRGSFEISGLYPAEIFSWRQEDREDGVYMYINIIPIQYNAETKQVKLYNTIDLNVDYSVPKSATNIEEVVVNNGAAVKVGMQGVPVNLKINSSAARTLKMQWIIRDISGQVIESGNKIMNFAAGENEASFSFDTEGWTSGMKDFAVMLRDVSSEDDPSKVDIFNDNLLIASSFSVIQVNGINLNIDMKERVIDPSENSVVFTAEVRDENGIGITGLTINEFKVEIDGELLENVTLSEIGSGIYELEFLTSDVSINVHHLSLTCTDNEGRSVSADENFVIRPDIAPPEVIKTQPAMNRSGVSIDDEITISFDELIFSGSEYENIQLINTSPDPEANTDVEITKSIDAGRLIITPSQSLDLNTVYTVVLPAGAVKDKKNNEIKYPYSFKFVTYADPDITAPVQVSTKPLDGTMHFPADASVIIYFNESIAAGDKVGDISWKANGAEIDFDTEYYASQLILYPKKDLPFEADCIVTLPAGSINDLWGNPIEKEYSFGFTIEAAPDTEGPKLVSTTPASGATNVALNTQIVFDFNESLKEGSSFDNIQIKAGANQTSFTKVINEKQLILSVTGLPSSTVINVNIPAGAVSDLVGNATGDDYSLSFTTKSASSGGDNGGTPGGPGDEPGGPDDEPGDPGDDPDDGDQEGPGQGGPGGQIPGGNQDGNTPGEAPGSNEGDTCADNGSGTGEGEGTGTGADSETGDSEGDKIIVEGSVNGGQQPIASTTGEKEKGSDLIPVTINDVLLNEKLLEEDNEPLISISVKNEEDFKFTGITGQTIKNMELKGATLKISTGLGSYSILAELFKIDEIAEQFGDDVILREILVDIEITRGDDETVKLVEDIASKDNFIIVAPPVEVSIECNYKGRKIIVDRFSAPVETIIPVPKGVNPEEITTAISIEGGGTIQHAITSIIQKDGASYAVVTSFSNGIYALVWNNVKFEDVVNHWSKEYVNEMGSRFIVNGVAKGIFKPDNDITRAEQAAMIVRTLGLKASGQSEKFSDVEEKAWYSDVIDAAREYGIITGYVDNTFRPMQKVTREESIAMIIRAMKLLGIETHIEEDEIEKYLQEFEDGDEFGTWSRNYAAFAVKEKLVLGSGGRLMPHKNITRSEAAVILLRMLKNR